jgi:hypothetical protein
MALVSVYGDLETVHAPANNSVKRNDKHLSKAVMLWKDVRGAGDSK